MAANQASLAAYALELVGVAVLASHEANWQLGLCVRVGGFDASDRMLLTSAGGSV